VLWNIYVLLKNNTLFPTHFCRPAVCFKTIEIRTAWAGNAVHSPVFTGPNLYESCLILYRVTHMQRICIARCMLWPGVCLSVRHKPVFYWNDCMDATGFGTEAYPTLCCKGFMYFQKWRYFRLKSGPKLWTEPFFAFLSTIACCQLSSTHRCKKTFK